MNLPTFPKHRSAGLLIAFGAMLWLVNWFPLQPPDYLCTATAVVSQERWQDLVSLSRTSKIDSSRILWLAYQNQHPANGTLAIERQMQPSLRVVKLRIGLASHSSPTEIDRELDRLTRVDRVVSNGSVVDRQLSRDRWRLQVAEHALTRFRLDREREGIMVEGPEATTPFRLASQSAHPSPQLSPLDRCTFDALRMEIESARQAVATTEKGREQSNAQSAGYIALTGAPRLSALPGAFSWTHLSILLTLGISILLGSQRWTYGCVPAVALAKQWLHSRHPRRDESKGVAIELTNRSQAELASSMQRLGIAYWGAIQTVTPLPPVPPLWIDGPKNNEPKDNGPKDNGSVYPKSPSRSRRFRYETIADAVLAAWVVAFLLRYAFDAVWRELLFRAPLAAFSSVVFGI